MNDRNRQWAADQAERDYNDFNESLIQKELTRLGVDYDEVGPIDSICVARDPDAPANWFRVYDDNAWAVGTVDSLLRTLRALPDNAGFERVWGALADFGEEYPDAS